MKHEFIVKYYNERGEYKGERVHSRDTISKDFAKQAIITTLNKWHKGWSFILEYLGTDG